MVLRKYRLAAALLGACAALAPLAAAADDLARGEQLFTLCTQCHGEGGEGRPMALAPAIAGMERWYVEKQLHNFRSGARGLHAEDVAGLRMYPMSLWLRRDEDVSAVSAYVASLPSTSPEATVEGGDAARGAALYGVCAACHGADGAGQQPLNAPALVGTSDWYLLSAIQKYQSGVRGSNPKNPNGMMMRGMALSLSDDQAVKDVVAHIMTLGQ